jgi:phenylacetate-CoA ligase
LYFNYRKKFNELGIKPEHIKSLSDVKYLPFTEKQDLRNNYPFGLFAVPKENVVRIHASSGTTGKSTVVGYTQRDVNNWAELMARSFMAAGVTRRDIIHNAYGYGLFTGGLGAHYGAEKIGATIVPVSGGGTKRQVMLLNDFKATVICCTPSYALHLYDVAQSSGIDFKELSLHTGIFGAEPWTEEMRKDIESKEISNNLLLSTSIAEFGLLLRNSKYKGEASYADVLSRAKKASKYDPFGFHSSKYDS